MPVISIDPSLTRRSDYKYQRRAQMIYDRTIPVESAGSYDYRTGTKTGGTEFFIGATFDDEGLFMGHMNYLDYLCQCYASHNSIVLTPDILWHAVLCEIATVVAANPGLYASLFTTTPDAKQDIVLATSAVEELPLGALIEALTARVPTDTAAFLPSFSTTDGNALFVRYAAFADICSPYYNYSTFLCGFPAIDVRGEPGDFARITASAADLAVRFMEIGDTVLSGYLTDKIVPLVTDIVEAVADDNGAFFKDILTTKRCGSGGEIEVDGWWAKRMYVVNHAGSKPENTPSHVSRVVWNNLDTGRRFSLNGGLFTSTDEDGFAVPQWGFVKNELLVS